MARSKRRIGIMAWSTAALLFVAATAGVVHVGRVEANITAAELDSYRSNQALVAARRQFIESHGAAALDGVLQFRNVSEAQLVRAYEGSANADRTGVRRFVSSVRRRWDDDALRWTVAYYRDSSPPSALAGEGVTSTTVLVQAVAVRFGVRSVETTSFEARPWVR